MSGIGVTIPGGDYCTFAPNVTCYPNSNGWPPCCEDDNVDCPAERPDCDDDEEGSSVPQQTDDSAESQPPSSSPGDVKSTSPPNDASSTEVTPNHRYQLGGIFVVTMGIVSTTLLN